MSEEKPLVWRRLYAVPIDEHGEPIVLVTTKKDIAAFPFGPVNLDDNPSILFYRAVPESEARRLAKLDERVKKFEKAAEMILDIQQQVSDGHCNTFEEIGLMIAPINLLRSAMDGGK